MIDAGADLHQQQRRDDEKILADAPLAWRQRPERRQHRIHRRVVGIVQEELVDEQHHAEGEEGEAEADPGPTEGVGGGRVADQRLIGPVLGPGPGHARPPRHRRQRGEHQEIRRLARELRGEAVGRRPARWRDWRCSATWRDRRAHVTMAAANGPGSTTSGFVRSMPLQRAAACRGRRGLLVGGEADKGLAVS